MAKRSLSKELLQETKPQAITTAAVGSFLAFFVYLGVVVTTEPVIASFMGSDSYVLAQVRGGEDADLPDAQAVANRIQADRDAAARQQAQDARYWEARRQHDLNQIWRNSPGNTGTSPRNGDRVTSGGSVYQYVGGKWVCVQNCKDPRPSVKTR